MWFMNDYEPKMPFKFQAKVTVGGIEGDWWDVKSVEKPSFAVTSDKYMLLNREIKFPTNIKWKPISITFVDNINNKLLTQLIKHYNDGEKSLLARNGDYKYQSTLSKEETFSNQLEIKQLDSDGNETEIWSIDNFHILDFKFTNSDYASDGLSEASFSIDYEWAYLDGINVELVKEAKINSDTSGESSKVKTDLSGMVSNIPNAINTDTGPYNLPPNPGRLQPGTDPGVPFVPGKPKEEGRPRSISEAMQRSSRFYQQNQERKRRRNQ
jgi:hypothetical protein